jgi:hypothetical protein
VFLNILLFVRLVKYNYTVIRGLESGYIWF